MELSAYPRHRKRCLNGFRASFALFPGKRSLGAPVVSKPGRIPTQVQEKGVGVLVRKAPANGNSMLADLADEICQEAGVDNPAPDAVFDVHLADVLIRHSIGNVIAMANPTRQPVRGSSEHLRVLPWAS